MVQTSQHTRVAFFDLPMLMWLSEHWFWHVITEIPSLNSANTWIPSVESKPYAQQLSSSKQKAAQPPWKQQFLSLSHPKLKLQINTHTIMKLPPKTLLQRNHDDNVSELTMNDEEKGRLVKRMDVTTTTTKLEEKNKTTKEEVLLESTTFLPRRRSSDETKERMSNLLQCLSGNSNNMTINQIIEEENKIRMVLLKESVTYY